MKKRLYLFFAVALACLATACVEDIQNETTTDEGSKMVTEKIMAVNGDSNTKAAVDADAKFTWSAGDQIAVHVSDGKYYTTNALAAGGSNTASFSVTYPEGKTRDAFAIFPASIVSEDAANYGQSDASLDVTLPASYTLAQVSGTTTPCPMIAGNTGNSWEFKQLCGLLRLTVNNIPASAKRLEIGFDGKNVAGNFSIPAAVKGDGTSTIALLKASGSNSATITITKDGSDAVLGETSPVLNIPLPVGEYANITITAYDALTNGNTILTTTRPFAYTASRKKGTKRTVSFPSSKTAFRGYEVSTGILERSKVGDNDATYSLTSGEMVMTYDNNGKEIYALPAGCNPFEPAVNYGQSSALNKYFHKWLTLRDELGADGNNINATSAKLPSGWQFPSSGGSSHDPVYDWGTIFFGAPKSPITVNGETLKKINYQYYTPFALVAVSLKAGNGYSVAAGTYYGLFLFRDGLTIPEGYFTKIGISNYADNPLTEAQFNDLVRMGCLFISASGYYSEDYNWRDLSNSDPEGYYWSNSYSSNTKFLRCQFYNSYVVATGGSTTSHREYRVVKLVKPVNP